MNAASRLPVRLSLVMLLFLLTACTSTPSRARSDTPSRITVGQSVRDDVLALYGTPDQIRLQPDEEVWIYDASGRQGHYIDAAMRVQAALAMPTSRASTNPAAAVRDKALLDAMTNMALIGAANDNTQHDTGRFTFDRRTERLRSITGPLPPAITK
jgi:hypothetical protein